MNLNNKTVIVIAVCVVFGIALFAYSQMEAQKEDEQEEEDDSPNIQTVLDSLWDDYKLYSIETTQYDANQPQTSITVYDEEDIYDIKEYLQENLSQEDLEQRQFDVVALSENQDLAAPYSAKDVVDSLWDNFGVHSTHFVKNDEDDDVEPEIFITVYVKKDIDKIEDYLDELLSEEELENYKIEVAYWGNRRGAS